MVEKCNRYHMGAMTRYENGRHVNVSDDVNSSARRLNGGLAVGQTARC